MSKFSKHISACIKILEKENRLPVFDSSDVKEQKKNQKTILQLKRILEDQEFD